MGAVWALILQTAFICVLSHWALRQEMARANIRTSFALSLHEWSMLMRFTLPVFISTMLATQAGWLSRTLLVNQPSGYDQMALISAANSWMNLVNFLPWTMGGVLAPIFANLYATHRRADFLKLLRHNLLLNIGVGLAVALPLMVFAPLILRGYGRDFREGVPIFVLTMICGLFITLNNLFSRAMQSAGKAWIDLASNGLWALVVLAGCWPLVHSYQGLGLVGAHTLAALALLIWQWLFVRRLLQNACQRTAPAS
jgi:O-antigen/teichoic acid export membrane protein